MWGSERSKAERSLRLALGGPWECIGHEAEPVAPVAVLGARARRQITEALILGEFSPRERARLERARAGVLAGYWTDEVKGGEDDDTWK